MRYLVLFVLLAFISCSKKTVRNPENPPILQYIAKAPELTILNAAIHRISLDSAFATGGPFTFFTPTDSAFLAAGLTLDKISQMDTTTLGGIIRYEITNSRINSDELFGFFYEDLTCLNPLYKPTISKNYYGMFLNGSKVIHSNILCADGVIQETQSVVMPPTSDALQAIASQPDLTYMTAFFNNMSTAREALLNNQVTLLAITDSGWKKFGFATLDRFEQEDTNFLYQNFIGFYIGSGIHFSPEFLGGYRLTSTLGNGTGTVDIFDIDGIHIVNSPVQLIRKDLRVTNGVVDVLDGVFYPSN